ncbi:hypothetical protein OS493_019036 [Desmophyllum pertusum]|uniref:Uncharacterized protein n=1 Tax=Desmophyllum pertusum TaxID=174260 RepID=A0A9W9YZT3_9CNID|nr:hypothetical protein OS493_019036 [Desmophyllum pertusum]
MKKMSLTMTEALTSNQENDDVTGDVSSEEEQNDSDEEEKANLEPKLTHDSSEIKVRTSVEKENVPSFTSQDRGRSQKPPAFSPLESLTLSQDKLKEIFQEKEREKNSQGPQP